MHVSVLQEAVSTGDPELVQLVLQYRDFKRATERLAGIPELLSKLRQVDPSGCNLLGFTPDPLNWDNPHQFLGAWLKVDGEEFKSDVSVYVFSSSWAVLNLKA